MTTTAASTPDVHARTFLLLLRLRLAGISAPAAVASAVAAAGIVPTGCFCDGSSCSGDGSSSSRDGFSGSADGSSCVALCRGELASPYWSGPRALSSDTPAAAPDGAAAFPDGFAASPDGPAASSGPGPGVSF